MANISFAKTKPEVLLSGRKTVTRRFWKDEYFKRWQKWFDIGRRIHWGYDMSPRSGGNQLCLFYLNERPYQEQLLHMTPREVLLEGFPDLTVQSFISDVLEKEPDDIAQVIRFNVVYKSSDDNVLYILRDFDNLNIIARCKNQAPFFTPQAKVQWPIGVNISTVKETHYKITYGNALVSEVFVNYDFKSLLIRNRL